MDHYLMLLTDPSMWLGLFVLYVLEIVLGVDNLLFLAIVSQKLPEHQQKSARRIGLVGALGMRLGLLLSIMWIMALTQTIYVLPENLFGLEYDHNISYRDIILLVGGFFLIYKAGVTIHEHVDVTDNTPSESKKQPKYWMVIAQIMVLDLVFSLDSIITAVGMSTQIEVMMAAVILAVITMLFCAEPLSKFISGNPGIVMIALGFLMMVGMSLVADGFGFHIPKGYLYVPMVFTVIIEALNMLRRKRLAA